MAMQTGENEQGLRKITDITRLISIALLALHFYYYCYAAFRQWQLTSSLTDRVLANIRMTGLFDYFIKSKLLALCFLAISLVGAKGRKDEKLDYKKVSVYLTSGILIYFLSYLGLKTSTDVIMSAELYIFITTTGYVLILTGGTLLSRVIQLKVNSKDVFNKENETFPQEERKLENE